MIDEKIKSLEKEIHQYSRTNKMNEYHSKMGFLQAYKNQTMDKFKKQEIARQMSMFYSLDEQISIILSGDETAIANLKAFRTTVETQVDITFSQYEYEFGIY